jgi:hypothetical protein
MRKIQPTDKELEVVKMKKKTRFEHKIAGTNPSAFSLVIKQLIKAMHKEQASKKM